MTLRNANRVRGSIMDVAHLQTLPSDDCNVLLVSSRTLYMLANYGDVEATFLSRYAKQFYDGGYYEPVSIDDEEIDTVLDVMRAFQLEVIPVTCDLTAILTEIKNAIQTLAVGGGCCDIRPEITGTVPAPSITLGPSGTAPTGLGGNITINDKCLMANWYYVQLIDVLSQFIAFGVMAYVTLSVTYIVGAILAIVDIGLSAAFWVLMTTQVSALTELAFSLIGLSNEDLQDIIDALEADQAGFICALYGSEDVGGARQELQDWCQNAGLTSAQLVVVDSILNNYVLAALFFEDEQNLAEAGEIASPYDCAGCGSILPLWSIIPIAGGGGGTLVEETETTFELSSETGIDGNQRVGVYVNWDIDSDSSVGSQQSIDVDITGGTFTGVTTVGAQVLTGNTKPFSTAYSNTNLWTGFMCGRAFVLVSTTAFTAKFISAGDCTP